MTDKRVCIKEFLFEKILDAHDRGDQGEVGRQLQRAMIPEKVDDTTIRLAGYDLDVTCTIYSCCKVDEVLRGWDILVGESVPVDVYLEAFYISTLYTYLEHRVENDLKVDNETYISNTGEPGALEFLRLSYWLYKCKESLDQTSFAAKFAEVRNHLTFSDIEEFRENLHRTFRDLGRGMEDMSVSHEVRARAQRELMQVVETGGQFRSNVSSYVPEFMSAFLMKKAGFDVNFIPSTSDKQCDILVNSFKMEVKTFLDSNDPILEGSLRNEILQTLKRDKAVIDIKDALSKKSGIVLIFLSFTSLGLGFLKYTYNRDVNFSLQKALTEAFHLAQHDRTVENVRYVEKIPVVTFTTAIDIPNLAYKMFFYTVPYPVKKVNDNFEPDKDKLKIDLNI